SLQRERSVAPLQLSTTVEASPPIPASRGGRGAAASCLCNRPASYASQPAVAPSSANARNPQRCELRGAESSLGDGCIAGARSKITSSASLTQRDLFVTR